MNYNEVIGKMMTTILQAIENKISSAEFDKTGLGTVLAYSDGVATVQVFGGKRQIECGTQLSVGQNVAVLAPQNNFNHLVILSVMSTI